ncbi:hypothetical protein BJ166DRAFT_520074 [Pestalotiopsis sp. NC0098]|nr:hypothetical protein BJ166DRAFT_520074 [Pestalotiopsis sp. NC0098]
MDIIHTAKDVFVSFQDSCSIFESLIGTAGILFIGYAWCRIYISLRRSTEREPKLHRSIKWLDALPFLLVSPLGVASTVTMLLAPYSQRARTAFVWVTCIIWLLTPLWFGFLFWWGRRQRAFIARYDARQERIKDEPWALHQEKFEDLESGQTWAPIGEAQGGESKEDSTDINLPNVLDTQSPNAAHITQ